MDMEKRITAAWQGRISGCLLGKPVEGLSMREGYEKLNAFLNEAQSFPLRDYINSVEHDYIRGINKKCMKGKIEKAEIDDDITYTVLCLMMLERYGLELKSEDVARTWLNMLPAGATFTAEREAYLNILKYADMEFQFGGPKKFEITDINDNKFNDWIGAQIRIDLYGWVLPGKPGLASGLARQDAMLSHRRNGVECSAFIAALGALIPMHENKLSAVEAALEYIDKSTETLEAVQLGIDNMNKDFLPILEKYQDMSPVHSLNNLALVVWAFLSFEDYDSAVGEAVTAGWDTDCNGATVGGLMGLHKAEIPSKWHEPWQGRVCTTISGLGELALEDLIERTTSLVTKFSELEDKSP